MSTAAMELDRDQIIGIYERHYNPVLALMFELAPCPVESRSGGTRVHTEDGAEYLDFAAGYGVFTVGHRNPRVQDAMLRQLDTMPTCPGLLYNEPAARLAATLAGLLPDDLKRVYLAGSGSEAIEVALRFAQLCNPERPRFVAVTHGFHGKTVGAVGVCGQGYLREPFEPIWPDVVFVPYGDADAIERAVGDGAAAVLLEPVLGGGYVTVAPEGYLASVRSICDRTGTLLILDEVQTGFGRTGALFAFQHAQVVPDVLILTKGMTGGHVSIAAAVVRDSVVARAKQPYDADPLAYRSESAASPIVCAAAEAAIRFVVDEDLPARARELGPYLQEGLKACARDFPKIVLGAPGQGLMTGAKVRNNMVENALWLQMLKRRVVVGLSTNPVTPTPVMRFFPPLTVTRDEIDQAIAAFRDALTEMNRMPGLALDLANQAAKFQYRMPKWLLRPILKAVS